MSPFRVLLLAILLPLVGSSPTRTARAQDPGPTRYLLVDGSNMVEGCFEPCECPIWMRGDLEGSFSLDAAGSEDTFFNFTVQDVKLRVEGTPEFQATGSGTYRISRQGAPMQELVLELEVAPGGVEQFSSGLVPAEVPLPEIRISVAKNNFYCYDQALSLVAVPVDRPTTWGTIKSLYTEE